MTGKGHPDFGHPRLNAIADGIDAAQDYPEMLMTAIAELESLLAEHPEWAGRQRVGRMQVYPDAMLAG